LIQPQKLYEWGWLAGWLAATASTTLKRSCLIYSSILSQSVKSPSQSIKFKQMRWQPRAECADHVASFSSFQPADLRVQAGCWLGDADETRTVSGQKSKIPTRCFPWSKEIHVLSCSAVQGWIQLGWSGNGSRPTIHPCSGRFS